MSTTLSPYQRVAFTLLRVVAAVVIMQHGAQKLFGALGGVGPNGGTVQLASLMGLAGVLEFFVALLVLLGLFTRPAAFLLSGEMATAYFMSHFPHGFWPVQNRGEPAVLLCFIFLFFAALGGGPYSLDALLFRTSRHKEAVEPIGVT
jgi:putative oxidoreductase